MAEKQVNIDCGRLRMDYRHAVENILRVDAALIEISLDDLSPIGRFHQHARQCEVCAQWEKEKKATIMASLNKD